MRITNAGQASFPHAYSGYAVYASYDRRYWFKVPTGYDTEAGVLTIRHTPTKVSCQSSVPPREASTCGGASGYRLLELANRGNQSDVGLHSPMPPEGIFL